jgi:hypothetical protein
MFFPSMVVEDPEQPRLPVEISPGVWSVEHCYDGYVEYFPGKPHARIVNGKRVEVLGPDGKTLVKVTEK